MTISAEQESTAEESAMDLLRTLRAFVKKMDALLALCTEDSYAVVCWGTEDETLPVSFVFRENSISHTVSVAALYM